MNRSLNIEILRMQRVKHTAAVLAVCALACALLLGALPGTQAQFVQSDQNRHIFVLSSDKDVAVSLAEPSWTTNAGIGMRSGTTLERDPMVTNQNSDCYMRVNMRILDKYGNTIDPEINEQGQVTNARMKLILDTIYYDATGGNSIATGCSYTTSDLCALEAAGKISNICNTNQFSCAWNSEMKAFNLNYTCEQTASKAADVFAENETARVFNRIVVPSDYTADDLRLMDEYYINVWVQVISTEGYDNSATALAHLSNNNVSNEGVPFPESSI